jgi:hypothetical protein
VTLFQFAMPRLHQQWGGRGAQLEFDKRSSPTAVGGKVPVPTSIGAPHRLSMVSLPMGQHDRVVRVPGTGTTYIHCRQATTVEVLTQVICPRLFIGTCSFGSHAVDHGQALWAGSMCQG